MENLTLPTEVLPYGGLEIGRVGIDFIYLVELSAVHQLEDRPDDNIGRSEQEGDLLVVPFPFVEEVSGNGVSVVYLPGSFFRIADGGEGIVAEDDCVVLAEEPRMEEYSPLEIDLTKSPPVFILSERDEFPGETERFWFQPFLAEKKRGEIRSEGFREHDIEAFRTSAVQEHIVDEADLILSRHKN